MAFSNSEREVLLSIKGVGETIIKRLEQLRIDRFEKLQEEDVDVILQRVSVLVGSTCWRNSPQGRAAITAVIECARSKSLR